MKKLFLILLALIAPSFAQNNARMLSGVNPVAGTTYPFVAADATRLVVFTSSSAVAATLPPGSTFGFGAGTEFDAQNIGTGTVTVTCTACLIFANGAAGAGTLKISPGQGVLLFAAGLNYYAVPTGAIPVADVRTYGALCNGVANDLAAINSAWVAAAAAGGIVLIPATANGCFVSNSITAQANSTLAGNGANSKIVIPAAGWNMSSTDFYGIVNIKNVRGVRVTGIHLVGNGAGGVDAVHTPKLIYFENVDHVQIDHDELEQAGCEGIWNGGAQTSNTQIDVGDNYLHDMELQSGFGACDAIPAIQMNADHAVIHNNRLKNVGTGIGFSGGHGSVTGNIVLNPKNQGISSGDSGINGPVTFAGNEVDVTANGAVAFNFNGGSGVDTSVTASGNTCYAHGGASVAQTCFWVATAHNVNLSGNTATINYKGTGFQYNGSTAGTVINSSGNVVQGQSETASINGFLFNPNGGGNTLTVNSANDQVYGITRALGSTAFSNNGLTGTLNMAMSGDVQTQGNNGFISNSSGQLDGLPFSFSGPGLTVSGVPLTPASTFSVGQGVGQFYTAGTSGLLGSVVCMSADNTVSKCGLGATNPIGQAIGAPGAGFGLAVQTSGYSNQPVLYDATVSPSAGWYACISATVTGKVTAQATPCSSGTLVGLIPKSGTNVTSGNVILSLASGVVPNWASPGAIGSGTPNSGAFTTLSASTPIGQASGGTNQASTVWADPRNSTSPVPSAGGDWCAAVNSLWAISNAIDATNVGIWPSSSNLYCNSNPFAGAPSGARIKLPCMRIITSVTWVTSTGSVEVDPCIASTTHFVNQQGSLLELCSDSTGVTGCGPNAYPSFELTALNKFAIGERHAPDLSCYSSGATWGAHFCKAGSTLSTGTATFTNLGGVTGSGTTWTSAMIGGIIADCDAGTVPGACTGVGRISAVGSGTSLTIANGGWRGSSSAAHSYTIWNPNVFVAYADGLGGSLVNTIFGHILGPLSFDLAGILNATAYYNSGGCQERCSIRGISVAHNNSNQTNVETNQAYACGVWDATFRPGAGQAHWNVESPPLCSTFNGGGAAGSTSSYGWLIDMYSIILSATNPGSGPSIFHGGSTVGASGHLFKGGVSLDGILGAGVIDAGHFEFIDGDAVEVGGTNAVTGVRISEVNVGNLLNGNGVHFLTATNGTNSNNIVENISSRLGSKPLIVDDANTSTNVTGTYVALWHQTGSQAFFDKAKAFTSVSAPGFLSTGTKFTSNAGCTESATVGGATGGKFTVGQNTACTIIITMGGGTTSANGWTCTAYDLTGVPAVAIRQTASTTTTCSLLMTVATNDVITFGASGY